jgi:glycosyltransferase involved in cell wall biosynthesis
MRVGLNLLGLVPEAGGVGRYMVELTAALAAGHPDLRLTAFHSRELPAEVPAQPWAGEVEWVRLPVNVTHGPPGNVLLTLAAQWLVQPALGRRRRLEIIHGLGFVAPPAGLGARTIVTIPDLIYTRYRDSLDRRTRLGMHVVGSVARRADRVIALSQAGATDIAATLRVPRDRIDVTPLGVTVAGSAPAMSTAALRDRHGLGDAPIVLCVAQKRPHKNLLGLMRAIELVPGDALLVLAGLPTPHERELRAAAGARVRFAGWVCEGELEGLYALADCCCLASFEEGFGLPILEAMARGVPVACSDAGAPAEIAGAAALTFDARDPAAIASALWRVLGDDGQRARLREAGHRRAAQFTWAKTAAATVRSYERALAGGR